MSKYYLDKLAIPISILALIMSVLSIYFSYFWHSEKMYISVVDITFDSRVIKTKIIFSNLGNRDEVMYSASYGYHDKYGGVYLGHAKEPKVLIVKKGESVILDLIEVFQIEPEHTTTKLSLTFEFLSIKDVVYVKFGCIDNKASKLYFSLSKLELSNIPPSSKNTCNINNYDSSIIFGI